MNSLKNTARSGTGVPLLAVTALVVLTSAGCSSRAQPNAAPPSEVGVAQVLSMSVSEWDECTGRVSAIETVELRPRVSDYVERVAFQEGQEVRKGDLLFVIDQRRYQCTAVRFNARTTSFTSLGL